MRTLQGEIIIEKSGYAVLAGVIGMAAASSSNGISPNVGFALGFFLTYVLLIILEVMAPKAKDRKAEADPFSLLTNSQVEEEQLTEKQSETLTNALQWLGNRNPRRFIIVTQKLGEKSFTEIAREALLSEDEVKREYLLAIKQLKLHITQLSVNDSQTELNPKVIDLTRDQPEKRSRMRR